MPVKIVEYTPEGKWIERIVTRKDAAWMIEQDITRVVRFIPTTKRGKERGYGFADKAKALKRLESMNTDNWYVIVHPAQANEE